MPLANVRDCELRIAGRRQAAVQATHGRASSPATLVPSTGFEPTHPAPEAGALSPELRGRRGDCIKVGGRPAGATMREPPCSPDAIHRAVAAALRSAAAAGALPALEGPRVRGGAPPRPQPRRLGGQRRPGGGPTRPGRPPRDIAAVIVRHLPSIPHLERVEVAGPGFVNFTLAATWYHDVLRRAAAGGPGHARSDSGAGERIQVEFVSSNPNGPLHIGHGRGGVVGDVRVPDARVRRATRWSGSTTTTTPGCRWTVSPPASRRATSRRWARRPRSPKTGITGAYLEAWGPELATEHGPALAEAADEQLAGSGRWGLARAMRDIEETLVLARIPFDSMVQRGGPAPDGTRWTRPSRRLRGARVRLRVGGSHLVSLHGLRGREGPGPGEVGRGATPTSLPTSPTTSTSSSGGSTG